MKLSHALDFPTAISADVIAGAGSQAKLTIEFDREARVSHQLLPNPNRLILDFERIGYGFEKKPDTWGKNIVETFRWGDMSAETSRMIFELDAPFLVDQMKWFELENTEGVRLEVALIETSQAGFIEEIDRNLRTASVHRSTPKSDRLGATPLAGPRADGAFTVVIDAGHGGIDGGATGKGGTIEKNVTLAFVRELRTILDNYSNLNVVLTRDSDVFLRLNERVSIARQNGAALFISFHADTVRQSYVRGATVYTISDRASDEVAAQVAQSENLSDEVAGITIEDTNEDVVDILIDLARQETHGFSVQFARIAIDEMGQVTRLIKNPHRHAGFRVLKAPDVPSVLVELGYLSNAEDEKLLNDEAWRRKMAEQFAGAIARFASLSGKRVEARL